MKSLFKFLGVVIAIVIMIALVLVIFDMTAYAHNPENTTVNAIITSIRNMFPDNWIHVYDGWRARFLVWLNDVFKPAQTV